MPITYVPCELEQMAVIATSDFQKRLDRSRYLDFSHAFDNKEISCVQDNRLGEVDEQLAPVL